MLPELSRNFKLSNSLKALFFSNITEETELDILIVLESNDISFRDLGSFLIIVDRFFGRLDKDGFPSYALSQEKHLHITQVNAGSIEILITDLLKKSNPGNVLIFFLLIKFLPSIVKTGTVAFQSISEAYSTYEKRKLVRYIRKSLRAELKDDEMLSSLDAKELNRLVEILEKRYSKDKKYLAASSRFARKKMKSITYRLRKK